MIYKVGLTHMHISTKYLQIKDMDWCPGLCKMFVYFVRIQRL